MYANARPLTAVVALLFLAQTARGTPYAVQTDTYDVVDYALTFDQFKFASVSANAKGQVYFRLQPDRGRRAAAGTTIYPGAYLAGADIGAGTIKSIIASPNGIAVSAAGSVAGAAAPNHWSLTLLFQYDPELSRISAYGSYEVSLASQLAAAGRDLNFGILASAYVPNYVGQVPAGDMTSAIAKFGANSALADEVWVPTLGNHFPGKSSRDLTLEVAGAFNVAFGENKPNNKLMLSSLDTAIFPGFAYDRYATSVNDDNVGIMPLVRYSGNTNSLFRADYQLTATPVPEPSSVIMSIIGFFYGCWLLQRLRQHTRLCGPEGRDCNSG
jgi:hypothetical protein